MALPHGWHLCTGPAMYEYVSENSHYPSKEGLFCFTKATLNMSDFRAIVNISF